MDISGKPPVQPKNSRPEDAVASRKANSGRKSVTSETNGATSSLKDVGLKQGQSYLATVLKVAVDSKTEAKQAAIQQILLKVENTRLSVMTDIPLEEGELIKVKVAEDFKLTISRSTSPANTINMEKLATLMARLLPYQTSLSSGLTAALRANTVVSNSLNSGPALNQQQVAALSSLVKLIPTSNLISKGLSGLSQIIEQAPPSKPLLSALQQVIVSPEKLTNTASSSQPSSKTTPTIRDVMTLVSSQLKNQFNTLSAAKDMPPLIKTTFNQLSALSNNDFAQKLFQLPTSEFTRENASARATNPAANSLEMTLIHKPIHKTIAQTLAESGSIGNIIKLLQQTIHTAPPTENLTAVTTGKTNTTVGSTLEGKPIHSFLQTAVLKTHLNLSGMTMENLFAKQDIGLSPQEIAQSDLKSALIKLTTALAPDYLKENGFVSLQGKLPTAISPDIIQAPFDYPKTNLQAHQPTQLSQTTELTAGELLKQIAATLNRIQFNQLNSLYQSQAASSDTTGVQTWMVDLPFAVNANDTELVQVKIEKFKQQDHQEKKKDRNTLTQQWKITLGFDFEYLGAMQIQVRWFNQKISSTLWADKPDTLQLLNKETAYFRKQLSELGYDVDTIECRHGKLPTKQEVISQNLVDVRT